MSVTIAGELLERLRAEATAAAEHETCGLLLGEPDRIAEAHAAANVADDPARTFEIDPAAVLAAHKAERRGGPRVLGCYHSHPSGSAVPSACDAAAAEPGRLWLILAGGAARLWRAGDGRFDELVLTIR